LSHEKYLTFNPGLFIGGSEMNYNDDAPEGEASGKTNIISPNRWLSVTCDFSAKQQKENARN
jgi:glutamate carboxypeptidase